MVFDGDDNWCRPLFHMKLILMFAELVLPTDKLNSHLPKISGFLARSVIVSIYICENMLEWRMGFKASVLNYERGV